MPIKSLIKSNSLMLQKDSIALAKCHKYLRCCLCSHFIVVCEIHQINCIRKSRFFPDKALIFSQLPRCSIKMKCVVLFQDTTDQAAVSLHHYTAVSSVEVGMVESSRPSTPPPPPAMVSSTLIVPPRQTQLPSEFTFTLPYDDPDTSSAC